MRPGGRLEKGQREKTLAGGRCPANEEQGLLGGGNEDVKGQWAGALNARTRRLPLSDQHHE